MNGDNTDGNPGLDLEVLKELMAKPITTVLTLRDHFALAALASILQNPDAWSGWNDEERPDDFAELAYKFADAMVKARGTGT